MSEEQWTDLQLLFLGAFVSELAFRDISNLSDYLHENDGQMPEGFWLTLYEDFRGQMRVDEIQGFWEDNRKILLPVLENQLPICLKAMRETERLMEAAFKDEAWALEKLEENRVWMEEHGGPDQILKNDRIGLVRLDSAARSKVVDLRDSRTLEMLIGKLDKEYGERATEKEKARRNTLIRKAIELLG